MTKSGTTILFMYHKQMYHKCHCIALHPINFDGENFCLKIICVVFIFARVFLLGINFGLLIQKKFLQNDVSFTISFVY